MCLFFSLKKKLALFSQWHHQRYIDLKIMRNNKEDYVKEPDFQWVHSKK